MKIFTRISLPALILSVGVATPMFADTIVPGQTITPTPITTIGTFVTLDTTGLQSFSFGGNGTKDQGTVEQLVVTTASNPYGAHDITFLYQFHVTKGDVSGISDSDFSDSLTSVAAYSGHIAGFTGGTLIAPSSVARSGDPLGANIQFNFQPNALPGDTSYVLVVYTNATSYNASTIGLLDSGGQTLNGFEPVVPEPSSLLLLGTGLLGIGGAVRRRFSI